MPRVLLAPSATICASAAATRPRRPSTRHAAARKVRRQSRGWHSLRKSCCAGSPVFGIALSTKRHPVLQGPLTAAHSPLADVRGATAHVDRQFAIRYQAFDSPSEIRRVGSGLRSGETQRQLVRAGTAVLRRLLYDLLSGAGERETRDEAVVEHSPGSLAPAQAVERADHLRPWDAAQPDDRFALRRPIVAGWPQRYQHRPDSLFCNLPCLAAIRPRHAR